jgi:hypothetical protein
MPKKLKSRMSSGDQEWQPKLQNKLQLKKELDSNRNLKMKRLLDIPSSGDQDFRPKLKNNKLRN